MDVGLEFILIECVVCIVIFGRYIFIVNLNFVDMFWFEFDI